MGDVNINRFYKEILSQLNFSIKGYPDLEKRMDIFFDTIINTSTFYERKHIEFISYAFASIKNLESFDVIPLHEKKFFYNAFKEYSLEVYALHEYLCFKNYLDVIIPTPSTDNQGAVITAKLFHNPTSFSIATTEKDFTGVHYDQHDDLLKIQVPYLCFFGCNDSREVLRRKIYTEFEQNLISENPKELSVEKKNSIYKTNASYLNNLFSKSLLCDEKIKKEIKLLRQKILNLNESTDFYFFQSPKSDDETVLALCKYIYAHAFLSFLVNNVIENMQSVVIDEGENRKKSIGVFIVGYQTSQTITPQERSMIKARIDATTILSNTATTALKGNRAKYM